LSFSVATLEHVYGYYPYIHASNSLEFAQGKSVQNTDFL